MRARSRVYSVGAGKALVMGFLERRLAVSVGKLRIIIELRRHAWVAPAIGNVANNHKSEELRMNL
jgi:hypothetical protein